MLRCNIRFVLGTSGSNDLGTTMTLKQELKLVTRAFAKAREGPKRNPRGAHVTKAFLSMACM